MAISKVQLHHLVPGYGFAAGIIRIMMDDACVDYEYHYHDKKTDWPNTRAEWIASGHPFDRGPMVELDGKRYAGLLPIMRFLSKKIGKYTPVDQDLEQYVDVTADYAMDWLRASILNDSVEEYKKTERGNLFERFERIYGVHKGPYAAGQEISYCDFFVHNVMCFKQNKEIIENYPNLAIFYEAFRVRPNVQDAIKQM